MGVDEVHRELMDVFPQVDSRALRAVAFAHANDALAAVEAVLSEVIPLLTQDLAKSSSCNVTGNPSEDASATDQPNTTFLLDSVNESLTHPEKGINSILSDSEDSQGSLPSLKGVIRDDLNKSLSECSYSSSSEPEDDKAISRHKGKIKARNGERVLPQSVEHMKVGARVILSDWEDLEESLPSLNEAIREDSDQSLPSVAAIQKQLCENGFRSETNSAVQERRKNSQESNSWLGAGPDAQVAALEEQDANTIIASSKEDLSNYEIVDLKDEATINPMVSRSGCVNYSIDLLEDLIEEARNSKETMVSVMDSVISLAKEVELQEKAVEKAGVEASRGCVDIHNKVQELKVALQRAKEANDMHAGEVYAEKAVLATEAKELQSRLLSLSEERDRSLRILEEMRESLEVRLSAAQKEIDAALQEKLENEASAREAFALQERIMEEVVQESKLLKQEAEQNSKLQDFLMDRGRKVDILQGEISVKCQDVKLLKEKIDSRIPLSTSLYSTRTILDSSSRSSSKSVSPPLHVPRLSGSYDRLQRSEAIVDSFGTLQINTELDSYQTLEQGPQMADSSEATKSSGTAFSIELLSYGGGKASDDEGWDLL